MHSSKVRYLKAQVHHCECEVIASISSILWQKVKVVVYLEQCEVYQTKYV